MTANKIHADKTDLKIAEFSMIPEYNRPEFVRRIPKEKDIFTVNASSISLNNMDWGFRDGKIFIQLYKHIFRQGFR